MLSFLAREFNIAELLLVVTLKMLKNILTVENRFVVVK